MIRILIADDEKPVREELAGIVARRFEHTAELQFAENGRRAVDEALLWGAELVLMDIGMPGMNGIDAARTLLAQRPGCKIIFVTAYSLFEYAHAALRLGACDYILKPVDADELEAAIRRAMHQIDAAKLAPVQQQMPAGEPAAADADSRMAMVMAQVRLYIEENYMYDLSLDNISEILHITPAYLSAQFKKYQKVNFLDCLTELRIAAAQRLLCDPLRSAAEVAAMVGYKNANYFARAFKKRLGMTPTEYRRRSAQNGCDNSGASSAGPHE